MIKGKMSPGARLIKVKMSPGARLIKVKNVTWR
jgi:hypothetical protein